MTQGSVRTANGVISSPANRLQIACKSRVVGSKKGNPATPRVNGLGHETALQYWPRGCSTPRQNLSFVADRIGALGRHRSIASVR